jgi:Ca-activated chloride channel family protein
MHPVGAVDLFAGQDLVILARYAGSGRARLVLEGRAGGEPVRWGAEVDFPARTRENPFIPRLWATQRVGWLSAEKRRGGGNEEIDAEIRELGERYGIPTEFTSYFVREPGMDVAAAAPAPEARGGGRARRTIGAGASAQLDEVVVTSAPEARKERAFEAARDAAAQRSATSLAAVDSMTAEADADGGPRRVAAGRTFRLAGGVWRDAAFREGMRVVRVQAYSEAYFALAARIPALREALALGERVLVAGRAVAVEVAAEGASRLDEGELRRIEDAW